MLGQEVVSESLLVAAQRCRADPVRVGDVIGVDDMDLSRREDVRRGEEPKVVFLGHLGWTNFRLKPTQQVH